MSEEEEVLKVFTYEKTHSMHWDVKPSEWDLGKDDIYNISVRPQPKTYKPHLNNLKYWAKAYVRDNGQTSTEQG